MINPSTNQLKWYYYREWIHNETSSFIRVMAERYIHVINPTCLTPQSQFTAPRVFERVRQFYHVPSSLLVLAKLLGHATTNEIQHMIQNGIPMSSPNDNILFMNNNFVSATATIQTKYITIDGGELDFICMSAINNHSNLGVRVLNQNESNWTVLRTRYSNPIDEQRIGLPRNQWTKQHCLLNHFLYHPGTRV